MKKITHERLLEIVHYDPETGIFTRKVRTSNRCNVGDVAGTPNKLRRGYIWMSLDHERFDAHRLAFFYMTKRWPDGEIDHINRIPDDNRWANLREADRHIQGQNMSVRCDNTTGVRGSYFHKTRKRWAARIQLDGRVHHLGWFKTLEEAGEARKAAEARIFTAKLV